MLLIGSAAPDERLTVASIPLNPLLMSLFLLWASSQFIGIGRLRYAFLWQLPLLPLGITLLWSPDIGYGAYKFFNLLLSVNLALLFWIGAIRDHGEQALARALVLSLSAMLAGVVWYKLQFGFFDRSVKFFLQGPITFARLMGLAMILCAFHTRGLIRLVSVLLFFAAIVWTGSKGPIIAAAVTLIILVLCSKDRQLRNNVLLGLAVYFAASLWALQQLEFDFLRLDRLAILWSFDPDSFNREGNYDSFTGRYWVAVRTLDLIVTHPFGTGLGGWESMINKSLGLTYPHNLFLELWSEAGVLIGSAALLSFTAFVVSPRSAWKYCALFFFIAQMFSGDLLDARYLLAFSILSYFAFSSPVWKR